MMDDIIEDGNYNYEKTIYEDVTEMLLNSREQGQMLESLIKNQIEVKDALIDRLYKELEHYKDEVSDRYMDQLIKGIIKIRKDMKKNITSRDWETMSAETIKREYQYIFEDITDFLEQQNIDAYSSEVGDLFNPSKHQAKIDKTDDPTLDKTVKESVAEGYKKGDRIILPERVIVYQLDKKEI